MKSCFSSSQDGLLRCARNDGPEGKVARNDGLEGKVARDDDPEGREHHRA